MSEIMLKLRSEMKKRRPSFARSEGRTKKVFKRAKSWRKPKGRDNKLRRRKNGEGVVTRGYSTPKEIRGLHASGFNDVLVRNSDDLKNIEPKTDAARIASSVGLKKKQDILKEAEKLKIKVLNPLFRKKIKKEKPKKDEKRGKEPKKEGKEEKAKKPKEAAKAKETVLKTEETHAKKEVKTPVKKEAAKAKEAPKKAVKKDTTPEKPKKAKTKKEVI